MKWRDFFLASPWWGKIIGAIFGFMAARGIGALIGLLVGNLFDRGLSTHLSQPYWQFHTERRKAVQKIFFEATFMALGHIAKADGRVSEQEIRMAENLMDEMQLTKAQRQEAKQLFNEGKQAHFDLNRLLFNLKQNCLDNKDLLKLFVDIQYRAARIEGLTAKKIKALDKIFSTLGFAPLHKQYQFYQDFGQAEFEAFRQQHQRQRQQQSEQQQQQWRRPQSSNPPNSLGHAYALLEIPETAGQSEVKKAYRRLISRNHPDKLISQGLPEEMIKMANEKTQKIRKAYEYICTSKGWNF